MVADLALVADLDLVVGLDLVADFDLVAEELVGPLKSPIEGDLGPHVHAKNPGQGQTLVEKSSPGQTKFRMAYCC